MTEKIEFIENIKETPEIINPYSIKNEELIKSFVSCYKPKYTFTCTCYSPTILYISKHNFETSQSNLKNVIKTIEKRLEKVNDEKIDFMVNNMDEEIISRKKKYNFMVYILSKLDKKEKIFIYKILRKLYFYNFLRININKIIDLIYNEYSCNILYKEYYKSLYKEYPGHYRMQIFHLILFSTIEKIYGAHFYDGKNGNCKPEEKIVQYLDNRYKEKTEKLQKYINVILKTEIFDIDYILFILYDPYNRKSKLEKYKSIYKYTDKFPKIYIPL